MIYHVLRGAGLAVCEIEARHVGPDSSSIKAADFQLRIHTTTCSFIWSTTTPDFLKLNNGFQAGEFWLNFFSVLKLNFSIEILILSFFLRFWSPCSSLLSLLPHRLVPDSWPSPSKTSSSSADLLLIRDSLPHSTPLSASAVPLVINFENELLLLFQQCIDSLKNKNVNDAAGDEREGAASQPRASSSYGGNDYVDYGAYTGGYGAFGWYTDHPVGNHGGSY